MVGLDERSLQQSASWTHLKTVIAGIIHERPSDAIGTLEARSTQQTTGQAVPPPVRTVYQDSVSKAFRCLIPPQAATETDFATRYADQARPIKKKKKIADDEEEGDNYDEDEDEEEDPDAEEKGLLTDIEAEQASLREFGMGLSEVDSHRIFVSLKKLLDAEPLAQVRFWGKITGTKRDYYIAEAKIDENRIVEDEDMEEEEPEEEDQEGRPADTIHRGINKHLAKEPTKAPAEPRSRYGSVNEYVYYVTSDEDRTNWVRLPDALPAQIVAAAKINKLFTGDLSAPVNAHPAFPGEERHYLRAQIARISHATVAAPKDVYSTEGAVPDDDDEDEDGNKKIKRFEVPAYEEVPPLNDQDVPDAEDPEAIAPVKEWYNGFSSDELLDPKFWVHIRSTILPDGRTTTFNPEDVPDTNAGGAGGFDDGEEEPEDEEPPQPPVTYVNPFLSDLSHDSTVVVDMNSMVQLPAWTVRKAATSTSSEHQRFLLRSMRWPGAVTFAETEDGKPGVTSFHTCYFGRGVKALVGGATAVAPPLPPMMMTEFPVGSQVKLQRDCTRDDEAEYEPMPDGPKAPEEDEEGEEDY